MILSIGEILADMVGEKAEEGMLFKSFCGGAPFNVAVNAKQAGAKVGFIGKVGNEPIGKFVTAEAQKANLDYLDVYVDSERKTTIAIVTLENGERDFSFFRRDTADFNITKQEINFGKYQDLSIVHLGSLMLSEKYGRKLAKYIATQTKKAGKKLSFDLNFRMDIYKDFNDAVKAYKPFVDSADIVKFSDDELRAYTGIEDVETAVKSLIRKDKLIVVTMGSKGSAYYYNELSGIVPTEPIKPIDTTGAGDAFFGTLLANIEGKELTQEVIESAMQKANKAGANATQFLGAIRF